MPPGFAAPPSICNSPQPATLLSNIYNLSIGLQPPSISRSPSPVLHLPSFCSRSPSIPPVVCNLSPTYSPPPQFANPNIHFNSPSPINKSILNPVFAIPPPSPRRHRFPTRLHARQPTALPPPARSPLAARATPPPGAADWLRGSREPGWEGGKRPRLPASNPVAGSAPRDLSPASAVTRRERAPPPLNLSSSARARQDGGAEQVHPPQLLRDRAHLAPALLRRRPACHAGSAG